MARKSNNPKGAPAFRSNTLVTPCVVEDILELRDHGGFRVDDKTFAAEEPCSVWVRGFFIQKDAGPGQFIRMESPPKTVMFGYVADKWISIEVGPHQRSSSRKTTRRAPMTSLVASDTNDRLLVEYPVDDPAPLPPPRLPPLALPGPMSQNDGTPMRRLREWITKWPVVTAALAVVLGAALAVGIILLSKQKPEKAKLADSPSRREADVAPTKRDYERTLFPNLPRD